jgi:hypothetical protein
MVGANPKFLRHNRWGFVAVAALFAPLSVVLVQCGKAPSAGMLAANTQSASGDTFEDRFPAPQFRDRFPTEKESFVQRQAPAPSLQPQQSASTEPSPVRVASIAPTLPRPNVREELTTLVSMKSSAFPYFGNNPRSEAPFLNISKGDRKGHRAYNGRVYWQDETYNDSRVLVHVPETFDVRKPGVIVVFFHGNGATLERDVRDRQLVPQQISDPGVNAVLLAPQLAVDAADPSAGKFWQPGGFKRFMMNRSATLRASTAIRNRRRPSPTCRSSSSVTAAASCRPPGVYRSVALPIASAACSCSMLSMASWTSSRPGSRTIAPASSSPPTPATPSGMTLN